MDHGFFLVIDYGICFITDYGIFLITDYGISLITDSFYNGNYGLFLIMGSARFRSSTVSPGLGLLLGLGFRGLGV